MSQLSLGSRHLNPFKEAIWKRGSRRWLGLRKGQYVRLERPAPGSWVSPYLPLS